MKASSAITTPEQYLASLPETRQAILRPLHEAIVKAAPSLNAHIAHGMLGYGPYHYRTRSGCEGDWFVVGLASQKNYVSLYLCACDTDGYLAEQNQERLGKVSVGKACVRFKKLTDLNLKVAMELVKKAAQLSKEW